MFSIVYKSFCELLSVINNKGFRLLQKSLLSKYLFSRIHCTFSMPTPTKALLLILPIVAIKFLNTTLRACDYIYNDCFIFDEF